MKKYLWLILVFAFVGMSAENLDSLINASGWEDFGDYKTQKLKIGNITHRQITKDGKTLFTADANKYFRFWDLETGKLLKSVEIVHQLPVFLLNDTLILFEKGVMESEYHKGVWAYSLIFNEKYKFLNHNFYEYPVESDQLLLNNCEFQLINDSLLLVPMIAQIGYFTSNVSTYFNSQIFNINNKKNVKIIKPTEFDKLLFKDSSHYVYDDYYHYEDKRSYGGHYYEFSIISRCDSVNKKRELNYNSVHPYRTLTINSKFDKFYYNENNYLNIVDFESSNLIEKIHLFEPLTNILIKNDSIAIAVNQEGTHLTALHFISKKNMKLKFSNQKQICKSIFNQDTTGVIITSNKGEIVMYSFDFLSNGIVLFEIPKVIHEMDKTIKFRNLSSFDYNSFLWRFGDGDISTDMNPSHFYRKEGKYFIELLVYENEYFISFRDSIEILPKYIPNFEIDKSFGITPLTVKFKNYSDFEADSIIWDINKGQKILKNIEEFEHTFDSAKSCIVTMTAYKSGTSFNSSRQINVHKQSESAFYSNKISNGWDWETTSSPYYSYTNRLSNFFIDATNRLSYQTGHSESSKAGKFYQYKFSNVADGKNSVVTDFISIQEFSSFNAGIGNKVLLNKNDTTNLYNYNGEKLFSVYNPDSLRFFPIYNTILIGYNNKIFTFNSKYLEVLKGYDFSQLSGFDSVKSFKFIYNSNRFAENQNLYVFIKSINNEIWCGEFDKNGFKEKKFYISNLDFSEIYLTNKNEFYVIDAASKLTVLDIDGNILYKNTEFNFNNYIHYKDDILVKFYYEQNSETPPPAFKFANKEGRIIYDGVDKLYQPKSKPAIFQPIKLFDNSFILLITFDGYMFMNYEFLGLPDSIPSSISSEKNSSLISPNPSTDFININQGGIKNLKIYDLNGIELDCKTEYFENMVRVNTFMLQTGIYFVRYEINGKIYNEKFVKY